VSNVPMPPNAPDVRPGRLGAAEYAKAFADAQPRLSRSQALMEAERCLYCHDAPCTKACPTHIDVPSFIRRIAEDNLRGAARTILEPNPLGGMCARVCPTENLCEAVCVRTTQCGTPVAIGRLQRYAVDALMESDRPQIFARAPETAKRVAVVGAGPAGLACAHILARLGHSVTIFDARPKAGGLNEYGLASYKTPDQYAQAEVQWLLSIGGISVQNNWKLASAAQLETLRKDFDAVFLGMGLSAAHGLGVPGEGLPGVRDAVDFIAELRQCADLSTLPVGRRVVVIGGGMTAVDAAVQSRLLGAESVHIVYRRGPQDMSASHGQSDYRIPGHPEPQPVLAGLCPPTDKEVQRRTRLRGRLGRRGLENAGRRPAGRQRARPALRRLLGNDRRVIGFNNIELISDRPLQTNLDEIRRVKRAWPDRAVVVSIMVPCEEASWKRILPMVEDTGCDGIELNFGCPHGMSERGMGSSVGQVPEYIEMVARWCKHYSRLPVIVKLTPNITDIRYPARAAKAGRRRRGVADQHHQLHHGRQPGDDDDAPAQRRPQGSHGGYCGTAVKPIALNMVAEIARDPQTARPADLGHRRRAVPGATPPSSSRWAAARCRCAPPRWCTASRSCRTCATACPTSWTSRATPASRRWSARPCPASPAGATST
jgi:dihydropyrimidine dehydrogenase (NAD+) subunit PreT